MILHYKEFLDEKKNPFIAQKCGKIKNKNEASKVLLLI